SRNSLKQRYLFDLILLVKNLRKGTTRATRKSQSAETIVSLPRFVLATLASVPNGRDCDRE
ncbi:MAG: hypothetical protein KIG91_05185, partial [Treponema sp.]|nr:hypothetical protein [Treponema sp.]